MKKQKKYYDLTTMAEIVLKFQHHFPLATRKKQPRKAAVVLNLGVHIEMSLDMCEELVNSPSSLEAKCTSNGDKIILPLV